METQITTQIINQAIEGGDSIAYASAFSSNISLLLSVLIGIIASILVLRAAGKMGGGLFGSVLNYIGIGMLIAALGTVSIIVSYWIPGEWTSLSHVVLFSAGYIFMVIGANKLLKGIMS